MLLHSKATNTPKRIHLPEQKAAYAVEGAFMQKVRLIYKDVSHFSKSFQEM